MNQQTSTAKTVHPFCSSTATVFAVTLQLLCSDTATLLQ